MKRQKQNTPLPAFGEILGGFDLLPKIGYRELEVAVGNAPAFMFWGVYLVHTKPQLILPPFCIVDNLDVAGKVFVIKDTRVVAPIVINHGPAPAVFSTAESRGGKWYHAGLLIDRMRLGAVHEELEKFTTSIHLVLGIYPLQLLDIHVNHSVKTEDDVYAAIVHEHAKN